MNETGGINDLSSASRPRWRRRGAIVLLVAVLGWVASSFAVTFKLTHRLAPPTAEPGLALAGSTREDLVLTTSDGERLGAWLFEGDPQRPCVLVMHGVNSCRSKSCGLIERLCRRRCTVLAVTLRAHGDSTGETNDIGWSARQDVVAAVELLTQRFPDRAVAICARSMSSAATIFAASDLGDSVDGYWLEQPFPTLDSAVWRRLQSYLPPVLDTTAYLGMRLWAPILLDTPVDQVAPRDHIASIPKGRPICILNGDLDDHLPLADVEDVMAPVRERARLVVFPGAAHVLLDEQNPQQFDRELDVFLEAVLTAAAAD